MKRIGLDRGKSDFFLWKHLQIERKYATLLGRWRICFLWSEQRAKFFGHRNRGQNRTGSKSCTHLSSCATENRQKPWFCWVFVRWMIFLTGLSNGFSKKLNNDCFPRFRGWTYTERYRSGDVCDRRRWRMKGAKRSGSGRNFAKRTASEKFRASQQDITGLTRNPTVNCSSNPLKPLIYKAFSWVQI